MVDDVPKHEMPISTYEQLPDTVLDYKKKHGIGRFDPTGSEKQEQKVKDLWKEVHDEGRASPIIFNLSQRAHAALPILQLCR